VLTLNIQEDAKEGRIPGIAWLIHVASADVVGLQESERVAPEIARLLGFHWHQLGEDTAVLSRFEIEASTPYPHAAVVRLDDGQRILIFDLHLYYKPYQPYQLLGIPYDGRFIKTEAEAIEESRKARGAEVAEVVKELAAAKRTGLPAVLMGDFNEPSHLDWTQAAAQSHRHPIQVAWPSTKAFEEAGFRDSYRQLYPDPMAKPGYTWTPTTRPDDPKDHHDRIDFILYRGSELRVGSVQIVGEDNENADIVVSPFPTDHRSVLTSFDY
jgi:endonuclease/exonuclease/phosphatase family metal-dependent hydrolase